MTPSPTVGQLLRSLRQRRHKSQLELARRADISQRHLSFLESGRSLPSREMVLRLARHLEVPPRERDLLLGAAGFASSARERPLGDPALTAARRAVQLVLTAHQPFPALAVDRHWTLVMANDSARALLTDVDPALLGPPLNVLRVSLHPRGLAPRILNFAAWREHVLERLTRQVELSNDAVLRALRDELHGYGPTQGAAQPAALSSDVAVPLELVTERGVLSFLSTTTVFGTPVDITLSELSIEAFLPANEETARALGVTLPGAE